MIANTVCAQVPGSVPLCKKWYLPGRPRSKQGCKQSKRDSNLKWKPDSLAEAKLCERKIREEARSRKAVMVTLAQREVRLARIALNGCSPDA